MKPIFEHFLKRVIDWIFRKRSPFIKSFSLSGMIILAIVGLGNFAGEIKFQGISINLSQGDPILSFLLNALFFLMMVVCFLSFIVLIIQYFSFENPIRSKKKIFVIEGRGLRDDDGTSLERAIGEGFPKSRIPYILDLRQRLDGKLVEPETLIPKVAAAKEAMNQARRGNGRDNTQVAYGGVTAVPLTFLTGVELDDEGAISVFDWDRSSDQWRPLDDLDDGLRLSQPDVDETALGANVVLAISISYPITDEDLATSFSLPVVRMELDGGSSNSHWSASKQSAIADQFFETAKKLSACGVKHIHLVLVAPNSVVFNFGRRYDKRNLPDITVYQYERSQEIKYPWGIRMPVGATSKANVEHTSSIISN